MRVIQLSGKSYIARHWFKWYRVQRGGEHWAPLKFRPRPRSITEIQHSLEKRTQKKSSF